MAVTSQACNVLRTQELEGFFDSLHKIIDLSAAVDGLDFQHPRCDRPEITMHTARRGRGYYEWNTKNRATAAQHVKSDTREQPKAQEELQPVTVRYLPPPGGTIVFAGAQLHETVANTTDVARYSIDFRTVHYDDVLGHRGARNVDSRSTGTTMRDYLRASDLTHLPEEAIALYDDASSTDEKVLYFGNRLASEIQM